MSPNDVDVIGDPYICGIAFNTRPFVLFCVITYLGISHFSLPSVRNYVLLDKSFLTTVTGISTAASFTIARAHLLIL